MSAYDKFLVPTSHSTPEFRAGTGSSSRSDTPDLHSPSGRPQSPAAVPMDSMCVYVGSRHDLQTAPLAASAHIRLSVRDNVVDDCSHVKFMYSVVMKRAFLEGVEDDQKNKCPLLFCQQPFSNTFSMLKHLETCSQYGPVAGRAYYRCLECQRAEYFPVAHCRSSRCSWSKSRSLLERGVKKALSMSKPLLRRLSKKEHGVVAHDAPACDAEDEPRSPSPIRTPSVAAELEAGLLPELFGEDIFRGVRPAPETATELFGGEQFATPYHREQPRTQAQPSPPPSAAGPRPSLCSANFAAFAPPQPTNAAADCAPLRLQPRRRPRMPVSSIVSVDSFSAPGRPSLISPQATLAPLRSLSPLSTTSSVNSARLTDAVFCDSPTDMGDSDNDCPPWASRSDGRPSWDMKASWDTIATTAPSLPGSAPSMPHSHGSGSSSDAAELEGSLPQPTPVAPRHADSMTDVADASLHAEHPSNDVHRPPPPPRTSSLLLEKLNVSLSAQLKRNFGFGPVVESLRSTSTADVLEVGIRELQRMLEGGTDGDAFNTLCFAYLIFAMAAVLESHLSDRIRRELELEVANFVRSGGKRGLSGRFVLVAQYFLDGFHIHMHTDLRTTCTSSCGCSPLQKRTANHTCLKAIGDMFPQLDLSSIRRLITDRTNVDRRALEIQLIAVPRLPQNDLSPDFFFEQYLPVVRNVIDTHSCQCTTRKDYHLEMLAVMQRYTSQPSSASPAEESRQNSWSSLSSTAIGSTREEHAARVPEKDVDVEMSFAAEPAPEKTVPAAILQGCERCNYFPKGPDRRKLLTRHCRTHKHLATEGKASEMFQCPFIMEDGTQCTTKRSRLDNIALHHREEHLGIKRRTKKLTKRMDRRKGPQVPIDID